MKRSAYFVRGSLLENLPILACLWSWRLLSCFQHSLCIRIDLAQSRKGAKKKRKACLRLRDFARDEQDPGLPTEKLLWPVTRKSASPLSASGSEPSLFP